MANYEVNTKNSQFEEINRNIYRVSATNFASAFQ